MDEGLDLIRETYSTLQNRSVRNRSLLQMYLQCVHGNSWTKLESDYPLYLVLLH